MSPPPLAPTAVTPQPGLAPGTLVLDGRFRVEKLLGGGGMGLVYLAEQVSLGRKVALKVLREDLPLTANMGERFRREALLLSSVDHPGVVRVIDFGHHGAAACLVMELVEGESLETVLLREAPMSVERTESILLQLAHGLIAIHERGIVHRDLKPDNVTLTKTPGGSEQARLLDFGIARLAAPDEAQNVTQVGFVLGTPEYMSPEQAMGQALDARSDVYSLGVMAYRMLTGTHPFAGPTAAEFVSQHIHAEPQPLTTVAPHLDAFPTLVALVTSMLAKRADARPQSAQEVIERLAPSPIALAKTLSSVMRAKAMTPPVAPSAEPVPLSHTLSPMGSLLLPAASNPALPPNRQALKAGLLALGVAAVVAAVVGVVVYQQPERQARRLIAAGRGSEALQIIEDAEGATPTSTSLKVLKATALYQVGRVEDARKGLEAAPADVALEPHAIEALSDDFGRNEVKDPRARKVLQRWAKGHLLPTLQMLARNPSSWSQWGALRLVDVEYAGQGLPLVPLYIDALGNRDCAVRALAARRLGELRSAEALAPLAALKAQRKKPTDPECGQDAASAALSKLERELNP